jgi:hypothetical protein
VPIRQPSFKCSFSANFPGYFLPARLRKKSLCSTWSSDPNRMFLQFRGGRPGNTVGIQFEPLSIKSSEADVSARTLGHRPHRHEILCRLPDFYKDGNSRALSAVIESTRKRRSETDPGSSRIPEFGSVLISHQRDPQSSDHPLQDARRLPFRQPDIQPSQESYP